MSQVVPVPVDAWVELVAKVEALESRVAALESENEAERMYQLEQRERQ